ncbi:hypothetical protein X945_1758 [Burkholderia pseudomallei ABCPW 107]|nr:hypothetical protein X945_1758 [Burkholderia pseudomallei ABCPW 107]
MSIGMGRGKLWAVRLFRWPSYGAIVCYLPILAAGVLLDARVPHRSIQGSRGAILGFAVVKLPCLFIVYRALKQVRSLDPASLPHEWEPSARRVTHDDGGDAPVDRCRSSPSSQQGLPHRVIAARSRRSPVRSAPRASTGSRRPRTRDVRVRDAHRGARPLRACAALDRHAIGAIGRADSVALHADARRIRSETPPARAPSRFGAASARAA